MKLVQQSQTLVNLKDAVIDSVENFLNHGNDQFTMEEMYEDKKVKFLTLLNRLGEDKVEELMQKLLDDFVELQEYTHHPMSDVPPC